MFKIYLVLLALLSSSLASAGDLQIGSDGSYRLTPKLEEVVTYRDTEIVFSVELKESLQANSKYKVAASRSCDSDNIGKIIPVDTHPEYVGMIDLFHHQKNVVLDTGVVCEYNVVRLVTDGQVVREEVAYNPYFILWSVSVIFMIIFNILIYKVKNMSSDTAIAAAAVACISTIGAAAAIAIGAAAVAVGAATVAAIATAIVVTVAIDANSKAVVSKKIVKTSSSIFYIAMIISGVLMYWNIII